METDRNLRSDRISPHVQIHARRICGEKRQSWMVRNWRGWNRRCVAAARAHPPSASADAARRRQVATPCARTGRRPHHYQRLCHHHTHTSPIHTHTRAHQYSMTVQMMMYVGKYQPRVVCLVCRAVSCLVSVSVCHSEQYRTHTPEQYSRQVCLAPPVSSCCALCLYLAHHDARGMNRAFSTMHD